MASQYYANLLTANIVAQSLPLTIDFQQLAITNLHPSAILYISFEENVSSDYIAILPKQELSLDILCMTFHYKASVDNVGLRLFGIRER